MAVKIYFSIRLISFYFSLFRSQDFISHSQNLPSHKVPLTKYRIVKNKNIMPTHASTRAYIRQMAGKGPVEQHLRGSDVSTTTTTFHAGYSTSKSTSSLYGKKTHGLGDRLLCCCRLLFDRHVLFLVLETSRSKLWPQSHQPGYQKHLRTYQDQRSSSDQMGGCPRKSCPLGYGLDGDVEVPSW